MFVHVIVWALHTYCSQARVHSGQQLFVEDTLDYIYMRHSTRILWKTMERRQNAQSSRLHMHTSRR